MGKSCGAVRPRAERLSYPLMWESVNSAVNEAIRLPLFVDRFALIGDEPAGGTPGDFAETIVAFDGVCLHNVPT